MKFPDQNSHEDAFKHLTGIQPINSPNYTLISKELVAATIIMDEPIVTMIDPEAGGSLLDTLSELPILSVITFVLSVSTFYKACYSINDKERRSVRIGIFIGFGGLILIAALAFFNHGPDVIELDIHDLPTLGLLVLFLVLFWFLLGAFLFGTQDSQKSLVSEVEISRQRGSDPDSAVGKLSEQLRTEVEIEFLENLLEVRKAKLARDT
ncbi:hypothetical protein N7478_009807 [Penicillium angulare]|uniref:uncharacterized protein n=1 Tax=Penicillium angulare TaxID=116970 RepID=UPI0025409628|nr:uncharacterized protein N7478_009807 [Penicillium angulare]KAJ5266999.1 hypothetical protein N7478_009807 [Penicillium angulare]